jgi:osmotically-inducible protein OsmY
LVVDYDTPYIFDPYVDDTYVDDDHLVEYEPRTPLASDTELKKSIQSELWWSPFVDADQVTVSVNDGIATLSGTVDTWGERQAATENAYQGGATLVDNDLAINF